MVERADGEAWQGAAVGDRFAIGGAVRTGGGAGARLRLEAGAVIRMGENALLRFQRGNLPGASAAEIRVERGAAEIEPGGGSELALVTAAGRTRVERGAHVRVRAQEDGVVLEVLVGRAVLLKPDGELAVEAGFGVRLRIGGALIEKIDLKVGAAILEPLAPAGEPTVAVRPRTRPCRSGGGGRRRRRPRLPAPRRPRLRLRRRIRRAFGARPRRRDDRGRGERRAARRKVVAVGAAAVRSPVPGSGQRRNRTFGTRARTAHRRGHGGIAVAHRQGTVSRALRRRSGERQSTRQRGAVARARQRRGAAAGPGRRQRHRSRRAPVHDPLSRAARRR